MQTQTLSQSVAFSIGQYVVNQRTQNIGQVVGYGAQSSDRHTTVKVLVAQSVDARRRGFIEEDLPSAWITWPATVQMA